MQRQRFDADGRAKEREGTPTVIGDTEYFPVRLSNTVTRDIRKLARATSAAGRKTEQAERQLASAQLKVGQEAGKEKPDLDALAQLQDEAAEAEAVLTDAEDEQQDASSDALFKQLNRLLVDSEGGHPDPEFLSENLDTRDAGPLMQWLMTDPEDAEGKASSTTEQTETETTPSTT